MENVQNPVYLKKAHTSEESLKAAFILKYLFSKEYYNTCFVKHEAFRKHF